MSHGPAPGERLRAAVRWSHDREEELTVKYRAFGQTALQSSVIGLGTWAMGGARYGHVDDRDSMRAIGAALDAGITCFDTSPSYGNGHAEELLGRTLGARRAEVAVATKGGLIWDEESHVLGRDSRRDTLQGHLERSLRRLRTDYVDLYLVHWPDPNVPFEDVMGTLDGFVRSGKARYVGVSNFTSAQMRACVPFLRGARLAANQVSFSLFDQRWGREIFAACEELGIGVMAYGPLAHGLLTGGITRSTVFDPTDWRKSGTIFGQDLMTPGNLERNLDVVARLTEIARESGATLPQLAVAWLLTHRPMTVALIGARTPAEITEAAGAAELALSEAALAEIEVAMRGAAGLSTVLPT